ARRDAGTWKVTWGGSSAAPLPGTAPRRTPWSTRRNDRWRRRCTTVRREGDRAPPREPPPDGTPPRLRPRPPECAASVSARPADRTPGPGRATRGTRARAGLGSRARTVRAGHPAPRPPHPAPRRASRRRSWRKRQHGEAITRGPAHPTGAHCERVADPGL